MSLPIYQKIYHQILMDIETGRYAPGDALPAEVGLAAVFDTSIGTVRKAIEKLVHEGFLEKKQGSGTFVRLKRYKQSLLRGFNYLAVNRQEYLRSLILEKTKQVANEYVAKMLNIATGDAIIEIKRLRIFGDNIRIYEKIYLPCELFVGLEEIPIVEMGQLFYPYYAEKFDIHVSRLKEKLLILSEHEESSCILMAKPGDILIGIERVALGYDHKPIEWRMCYGLAHEYCYDIEVR